MDLRACMWSSLEVEMELFGSSSPDARVLRFPGVLAACAPAAPDRSIFNGVVCRSTEALAASYDALLRAYADAGVRAFTVWGDARDAAIAVYVTERGHVLDAQPTAMAAEIDALELSAPDDLEVVETRALGIVGELNDAAFGMPSPGFRAACAGMLSERWRGYVAYVDARAVSALLVSDGPDGDLGVTAVATLPAAQGRRLASRLLSHALREARARGMTTTSLQATRRGRGTYARLGYQDLGALAMWERRVPQGTSLLG